MLIEAKIPILGVGYFQKRYWPERTKRSPREYRILLFLLIAY